MTSMVLGVVRTLAVGAARGALFSAAYDTLVVQPIEMHFEPGRTFSLGEVGEYASMGAALGGPLELLGPALRGLQGLRGVSAAPTDGLVVGEETLAWRTRYEAALQDGKGMSPQRTGPYKGQLGEALAGDILTAKPGLV